MTEYTQEQLNEIANKNVRVVSPFCEILTGWKVRLHKDGTLVLVVIYDVYNEQNQSYTEYEKEVLI